MAALGWLLNLDFAASDGSITTSFPGPNLIARQARAKVPRAYGYGLRYIWGALCWMG